MTLSAFLLLTAYYLLKTVREPLILLQGGAEVKLYARAGQALLMVGVVHLYGELARRVGRMKLLTIVFLFFISNLAVFTVLAKLDVPIGLPFFLWVGVFSYTVVAQFWALAADIYSDEQGKRLFPIIGAGSSIGAVVGGLFAKSLVPFGPHVLMGTAVVILLVCVALIIVDRAARRCRRRSATTRPTPTSPRRTRAPGTCSRATSTSGSSPAWRSSSTGSTARASTCSIGRCSSPRTRRPLTASRARRSSARSRPTTSSGTTRSASCCSCSRSRASSSSSACAARCSSCRASRWSPTERRSSSRCSRSCAWSRSARTAAVLAAGHDPSRAVPGHVPGREVRRQDRRRHDRGSGRRDHVGRHGLHRQPARLVDSARSPRSTSASRSCGSAFVILIGREHRRRSAERARASEIESTVRNEADAVASTA